MCYKQPKAYMEHALTGHALQEQHDINASELGFEFMMNALRLTTGFPSTLFQARTGLPLTSVERPLREAETRGLITRDLTHIRPTPLGQRFLNDLLQLFFGSVLNTFVEGWLSAH